MQTKIVLVLLLIVVTAFFYLHTVNPVDVTFYIAEGWVFVLPVTVFLFAGFFAGVVLTVFNIIVFDIRRGIKTLISKRNQKALVHSGEDSMEGELARLKGDPARAEELFKRSYELNSSNRTALFSLVDLYVEEEKFTEAYALVEGELGDDSGDLVLLFKLVDAALNAEDMDKAERTLEAILRVDNDNPIALKHLRAINERCEAWEEAASIQKTLLKQIKQPSEDDLRLYAAYNFEAAKVSMDGGELDDAKEKVKVSLKAEPDFIPSLVLRGEIEVRKGNVEAAIEKWLTAFNEYGDPVLLIFIEDLLLTESSPERALLIYKEATEASPLDTTLKLLFASFMLRLEMVDEALTSLELMEHEGELTSYGKALLAEAYLRRSESDKAAKLLLEAVKLDGDLNPPFSCTQCGTYSQDWFSKCSSCSSWASAEILEDDLTSSSAATSGTLTEASR